MLQQLNDKILMDIYNLLVYSKVIFFLLACIVAIKSTLYLRKRTEEFQWNTIKKALKSFNRRSAIFLVFFLYACFTSLYLNRIGDEEAKLFASNPLYLKTTIIFTLQALFFSTTFLVYYLCSIGKLFLLPKEG